MGILPDIFVSLFHLVMEIIGYIAALFIGLALGITGSGGSILTVPILVYLMRLSPVLATSYSLFVVGATSLAGGFRFYRQGLVHFRTVLIFGLPSLTTVYFTRRYLIPAIPSPILSISNGGLVISREMLLLLLFALLMVFASFSMIRENCCRNWKINRNTSFNYPIMILVAIIVGLVSGLVGAGGGFLIIPALVIILGLDIKRAVGTSLLIIAANSLFGFIGDMFHYHPNWSFLLVFSSLSMVGIAIGAAFAHKIDSRKLKQSFGWFVLIMGLCMLIKEIFSGISLV